MERTYTIPLRKAAMKAPIYLRTNRAVREVKIFLKRHMKSENVKLGEELNKALWARGDSKPPHHVTIVAKKEEDNAVYAELAGKEFQKKDFSDKEDKKESKTKETKQETPATPKEEAVKVEKKAAEKKPVEKAEKPAAKKEPAKKTAKK